MKVVQCCVLTRDGVERRSFHSVGIGYREEGWRAGAVASRGRGYSIPIGCPHGRKNIEVRGLQQ